MGTCRKIFKGGVWLVLAFLVLSCSQPQEKQADSSKSPRPVTIAVSRTPLSAPFYIARAKGYFAEQGLDVSFLEMAGGHLCLQAVLAGNADMGTASDLPIMFKSFTRHDFKVIATFVTSYNDVKIIGRRDSGIRTASDLGGRRIGVVRNASSQFFLDSFLVNNGLSPDSVTTLHLEPPAMAEALSNDEVDAVAIWEPFGFESMTRLGDRLILLPHGKVYRETFNLSVSSDYAEKNTAVPEKTLRALKKAVDYIRDHRDDAQRITAADLEKDEAFIQWIWDDLEFDLQLDQALIITLEDEARWAIDHKLVDSITMPNFLRYIDIGPLSEVHPAGVKVIH